MKRINLIIQAALFLLIAVLYILYFTNKSSGTGSVSASGSDTTAVKPVNSSVVYVNIDTIIDKYQMAKDLSDEINKKGKQYESELATKQKNLQDGAQNLRYKAERGLELRSKLEEMGQQLAAEEQNLYKLRDSYAMQIQEEHAVSLRQVMNSVMEYLKEYCKDKNYHYILGNSFDGKILYANETLDITVDVLKGLNEKYTAEKNASKKK
jgi:outer membrane protein